MWAARRRRIVHLYYLRLLYIGDQWPTPMLERKGSLKKSRLEATGFMVGCELRGCVHIYCTAVCVLLLLDSTISRMQWGHWRGKGGLGLTFGTSHTQRCNQHPSSLRGKHRSASITNTDHHADWASGRCGG
jgi:hypothetical protein